ncbi:MAG TPA: vWA domain-containing protein, partial [Elusimicrobiota bacterium]|nr:vWA domain-containing protein [Elusimicrobiota bacterium]
MNLTRWLKARRKFVGLAAALGARLCLPGMSRAEAPAHKSVEVVFVLDTTGSMGGLLQGAKDKIWSIANEIAKGKPTPKVRMGIVAYRDRGDEYVTKDFDLTTNLDAMYKNLLTLKADGGGDTPEHVLKGIQDAVEKMSWSKNKDTFRVVYLVGDAPAHTNYGDTPTFEQLAQAALKKGVVINAIECGNDPQAAAQWQQLAKLGEG